MMRRTIDWTPALCEVVQRLVSLGYSYSEVVAIADPVGSIGLTKNAIAGRIYRGALRPREIVSGLPLE